MSFRQSFGGVGGYQRTGLIAFLIDRFLGS